MAEVIHKINQSIRGSEDKMFNEDRNPHDFQFDEDVARVFDNMVSRSVPMYQETMSASMDVAKKFIQQGTNVFDIGCSTGTLLLNFSSFGARFYSKISTFYVVKFLKNHFFARFYSNRASI